MFKRVEGYNHGIFLRRVTAVFGPTVANCGGDCGLTLQGEWRQGCHTV